MAKLSIPPDKLSYTAVFGNEVGRIQVRGGPSRYRRDLLGANSTVGAQWTLTREEYRFFMLFWRAATLKGSSSFTVDLFLDSSEVAEYTCYILPETLQLLSQSGDTFVVGAQLEVEALPVDTVADNALIAEYGTSDKLELIPDQAQYAVMFSGEGIRVQLDGGAGAYRRTVQDGWHTATVQWTLTPAKFDYLMAFRRTAVAVGSLPFEIDVTLDDEVLTTYNAYFIPETFQLVSHGGLSYVVTAQLELQPTEPDFGYEEALLMLLASYGDDAETALNLLEKLVNVDINSVA